MKSKDPAERFVKGVMWLVSLPFIQIVTLMTFITHDDSKKASYLRTVMITVFVVVILFIPITQPSLGAYLFKYAMPVLCVCFWWVTDRLILLPTSRSRWSNRLFARLKRRVEKTKK